MPLMTYNGGYILGGVTDQTPDWLGAYNEGMNAAIDQNTALLNQKETKQRMAENAAAEARRAAEFGWKAEDRQLLADAANSGAYPGLQMPQGPGLGPLPTQNIPAPIAPNAGLLDAIPPANTATAAPVSGDLVMQLLPEWARMEQQVGLPANYLETVSMLESSGGTNTGNGQYVGVFQIGPDVARQFGVTPEQLQDPRINSQVAAKLAAQNNQTLRNALGRDIQPWELYLAHQQGAGGAIALLRAPTMNAVDALAQAYGGDRNRAAKAIVQNGGNTDMTAAEFASLWQQKYAGGRPQPFTGTPGGKEVPAIPGLHAQATRPGRMGSAEAQFSPSARTLDQPQPQTTAGGRGDIPAGLNTPFEPPSLPAPAAPTDAPSATSPAPAAPAAPTAPPAAAGQPGLAPPVAPGDVVPSVSQADYAGISAPGQGSIAQQIMRAPMGQQATLPDSGQYIVEPAKIRSDLFELQQARQVLAKQYERAKLTRDLATMSDIEGKAVQINAGIRLLENMKSIAALQAGDVNMISQTLSRLTGGQVRIQPRSDGKYNIFNNGKMTYEGVTKDAFIAALRMEYDQQYQAQVAAAVKRQDVIDNEVLKSQLKSNEAIQTRQADALKEIAIENFKSQLAQQYPEYNTSTTAGPDGAPYIIMAPKNGGGQPFVFTVEPALDMAGNPLMVGGQPKMRLKSLNGSNSVPVQ